jgi:hypothetical protein
VCRYQTWIAVLGICYLGSHYLYHVSGFNYELAVCHHGSNALESLAALILPDRRAFRETNFASKP